MSDEDGALPTLAISQVVSPDETLARIEQLKSFVKQYLREGEDYGKIPGTDKPTLLKPGAEKLCDVYGLTPRFEILEYREGDGAPAFFAYTIRCSLYWRRGDLLVCEGLGEANSWEGRYRWRWVFESQLPPGMDKASLPHRTVNTRHGRVTQYRVPNEDIWAVRNTILKQAKKRALVDAVLTATRSSGIFTQDVEDFTEGTEIPGETVDPPTDAHTPPSPSAQERTKAASKPRATPAPGSSSGPDRPEQEAKRRFAEAYAAAKEANVPAEIQILLLSGIARGRKVQEWTPAELVQGAGILESATGAIRRGITPDVLRALWDTLWAGKHQGPWTPAQTAQLTDDIDSLRTDSVPVQGGDNDELPAELPF